ncbi:MAG: hypothetical protein AAF649_06100 [Verrucomicrobiota bacterium]
MKSTYMVAWFIGVISSGLSAHSAAALINQTTGLSRYTAQSRCEFNDFEVYLPESYPSQKLPLVFIGHPKGGSARKEMKKWIQPAEAFPFIAVTLTLISSSKHSNYIPDDIEFVEEVIQRTTQSLRYDENHVIYTAFSGGGYAGWQIIATEHDELFTGLCFRSANCNAHLLDLPATWKHKPIYVFWSDNDAPFTRRQNPALAAYLKEDLKAQKLKTEIIPGGGHRSRPEKFIQWLADISNQAVPE